MPTIVEQQISQAARMFHAQQFDRCVELLQSVLSKDPKNAQATSLLALSFYKGDEPEKALEVGKRYTEERPEDAEGWYNLGMFYAATGDAQSSLRAHQEAIKRNPKHVNALVNVGVYFSRAGLFEQSLAAFSQALTTDPTNTAGCNNFANTLKDAGLVDQALKMYERTLQLQPNLSSALSNYCYVHQFVPHITLAQLSQLHEQWDRRFGQPHKSNWPEHTNNADPSRMLRVGFISEDFRHHTVGHYLVGVLEHLPGDLAVYCYSLSHLRDEITERFESLSEEFRNVKKLSDTQLFNCVREDTIDVLFDLSGHTSGNRLGVFVRKPAPVQMTWLGYVGTTGLAAIDYKIGSHMSIPDGTEQWYSEQVMRFPAPYAHQCYQPCFGDVEIGPPPSRENGYVTFGTFSTSSKLNEFVLSVWASILREVPDSRLLLKGVAYQSEFTRSRISKQMEEYGISSERLIFEGFSPPPAAFETYNNIDVALDPWPFSGCTTTCEALWMGVPIVTWPQQTEASRHSVSFLNALGMVDGIARDADEYRDIAVTLAMNEKRRADLRETLRDEFLKSPACDVEAYGQHLGDMIRTAWRTWCER